MNGFALPTPCVIVLAAGFSTRFGRPKPLARIHGLSLLVRTVTVLTIAIAHNPAIKILVIVPPRSHRYRVELQHRRVVVIENPRRADGLSSSVKLGVRRAKYSSAVFVMPVDLGQLRARDLSRLLMRWRLARRRLVATRVGQTGGTPLILPKHLYRPALQIADDAGLRGLVRSLPSSELLLIDLPHALVDVDTPQDLAQARRRFTTLN